MKRDGKKADGNEPDGKGFGGTSAAGAARVKRGDLRGDLRDGLKDRPQVATAARVPVSQLPSLPQPRGQHEPVWRQLADLIRQTVGSGAWRHGDRLPTEAELAAHFSVNRHTLRKAVGLLVRDRVLTTVRGRGTFVSGAPPLTFRPPWNGADAEGFAGQPIAERFLGHTLVEAGERLGGLLALRADTALHRLDIKMEAGTVPVVLARYWLPVSRFERLDAVYRSTGSVGETLARFGFSSVRRARVEVSACMADDRQAGHLTLAGRSALITVLSVGCAADGRPLYVSDLMLVPERSTVVVDPPDSPRDPA